MADEAKIVIARVYPKPGHLQEVTDVYAGIAPLVYQEQGCELFALHTDGETVVVVEKWRENRSWMQPDQVNADFTSYVGALQTWVLRSEGKTILIDTGAGNGKDRPLATFAHLHTSFLADLAAAGAAPDEVDVVVNTHLHLDHTGWNTRLEDGQWGPTFPNARYLIPKTDFDFWNPASGHVSAVLGQGNDGSFTDSVEPVHQAGQTVMWEDSYTIDSTLRRELAPWHTPASSVLKLHR